MTYETIPTPVEAHQQQLVSAEVPTFDPRPPDAPPVYAKPGDWIVKWPDGRLEVFTDAAFAKRFRKSTTEVCGRELEDMFRRAQEEARPRVGLGGVVTHSIGPVVHLENPRIDPLTPKCEGTRP